MEITKPDPVAVNDILVGHANTNNVAASIGRWAVLKAGPPLSVLAQTVTGQVIGETRCAAEELH